MERQKEGSEVDTFQPILPPWPSKNIQFPSLPGLKPFLAFLGSEGAEQGPSPAASSQSHSLSWGTGTTAKRGSKTKKADFRTGDMICGAPCKMKTAAGRVGLSQND